MAATSTTGFSIPLTAPAVPTLHARRRRITMQAGHALEILGHAIEYLTDELVHEGGVITAKNGQLQAVQILMALNRQVYFECPEVSSFAERCSALLPFRST